jgi:hypothetical protein
LVRVAADEGVVKAFEVAVGAAVGEGIRLFGP